MPISQLLKKIAFNKHKHIVHKGGAVKYYPGARNILRGSGTVARHFTGGELAPHLTRKMSYLSMGEGIPEPKHFTKKQKSFLKPIKFNF